MNEDSQLVIIRNYRWNFTVNSLNAAFYTVAMTFASIVTFLPLFIEKLGGSNLLIGLVPSVAFIGYQLPGMFSAAFVENMPNKLRFVKNITLIERLPFLILALLCLGVARENPQVAILFTFVCLILITFTSGTITPAWLDYIVKVTPRKSLGMYFAMGSGLGGLIGIGASFWAGYFLKTYPFPTNFFYCFIWAFVAVMLSYGMTLLGREPSVQPSQTKTKIWEYYQKIPLLLSKDGQLRNYIIFRNLQCLGSMASTFFVVYGVKRLGFPDQSASWMTVSLLLSQSMSFFLWGYIGDRYHHKIVLIFGAIGLSLTSVFALFFSTYWAILMVFVFLGWYYSAQGTSGLAILRDMAPEGRYPTYLALSNGLTVLAAFLAPVLGGRIADLYSYRSMFWLAFCFSVAGLLFLLFFIPMRKKRME
ncbi:MAG TPA: MFS transporter [Caldisericia bacterium]|nr:MFS transporter [Caldisericia bacterium]